MFDEQHFNDLVSDVFSKLQNDIAQKKKAIIQQRLKEMFLYDIADSVDSKFPRIRSEKSGNAETFYGDDGTKDGTFIVTFFDKPPYFKTENGKFEYCLDFDYTCDPGLNKMGNVDLLNVL